MSKRFDFNHDVVARWLVWLALSAAFLGYVFRGRELTSVTDFYFIRRSVPEIWSYFHDGLPQIGNPELLDAVYWFSIVVVVLGSLVLLWLALAPDPDVEHPAEALVPIEPELDPVPGIPDA